MRAMQVSALMMLMLVATAFSACGSSSTTTTAGSAIADGERFGFVREVAAGALVFDSAEFLMGDAAIAAAREAGVIGEDEDLPNDFFIRNTDSSQETVPVDPAVTFTLVGFDSAGSLTDKEVSYADLEELFAGDADTAQVYGFVPGELPMTLTFAGGKVVGGVQQYLP